MCSRAYDHCYTTPQEREATRHIWMAVRLGPYCPKVQLGADGRITRAHLRSRRQTGETVMSDKFLTRAWNNQLTLLLGLPTLTWAVVALATPVFSDLTAFIGMVVFAAVY